mgnify:FL=1
MRIVYKRSLTFIAILIVLIGCIGIGYLFYDKVILDETQVVVNDELSINYLDGQNIITNGEYRFSVTNNGNNDVYYRISVNDITGYDENLTYTLTSNDTNIKIEKKALDVDNPVIANNILIPALETKNFILSVNGNTNTSFSLNVEKIEDVEEYFYMTILNNNELKKPTTVVGEEISSTNEGLIEDKDDDGATYYFRGAVDNNYVSFANLIWRIVRINGDGTVRLVLNETIDTLSTYNTEETSFKETALYDSLETFYENNLSYYEKNIANSKFCSETSITDNKYNAYTRIITNEIPTFNCLGTSFISRIGTLMVDEIVYAGALYDEENTNYYLYNSEIENLWWTSSLARKDDSSIYPFLVSPNGSLTESVASTLYRGVRPVINLSRNTKVSGTGTLTDPYTVN